MNYYYGDKLFDALRYMNKTGGRQAKAADQIDRLLGRIARGEQFPFHGMRQTKNGESRIKGCVKYDLQDYCRLITVLDSNFVFLLFAGTHEDCDRWLQSNTGWIPTVNPARQIIVVHDTSTVPDLKKVPLAPDNFSGDILSRLPDAYRSKILDDLKVRESDPFRSLRVGADFSLLIQSVSKVENERARALILDVLNLLNSGDVEGATRRIDLESRALTPLSELNPNEYISVSSGDQIRSIKIGSDEYERFKKAVEGEHSYKWFVFLHPEQEKIVESNYSGPAKLSGVSGSGKTAIAIMRAIRLAKLYQDKEVAIVTLNKSLASYIDDIVSYAADGNIRSRIKVFSLFSLSKQLLLKFEPENERLYEDSTWKTNEHKDEVYREFYRCLHNNNDGEALFPIHQSLVSRGLDAEKYICDEFDWLRSVIGPDQREQYLQIERKGRRVQLLPEQRRMVLNGLKGWERKMRDVGVIDYLGMTTSLFKYKDKLSPIYRSLIIDEAQDFGSIELEILRKLVPHGENDIFLCGDSAQNILPKHQSMERAGIIIGNRSAKIARNYRNSREILRTAHNVFVNNLEEEHVNGQEFEIADPILANRSGAEPVLLKAATLEQEIAYGLKFIDEEALSYRQARNRNDHKGCLVICGYTFHEIKTFAEEKGLKVLDAAEPFLKSSVVISDMEQAKGYEFDTVVIVNCNLGALPPLGAPQDERYRYACQLYVCMTRAKTQLVLSYSGELCPWLYPEKAGFREQNWSDFISQETLQDFGAPLFLPELIAEDDEDYKAMSGKQFVYSIYALGLDVDTQNKLVELTSGRTTLLGGRRYAWRSIGSMFQDLEDTYNKRGWHALFSDGSASLRDHLNAAIVGGRPVMKRSLRDLTIFGKGNAKPAVIVDDKTKPKFARRLSNAGDALIRDLPLGTGIQVKLARLKVHSLDDLSAADEEELGNTLTQNEIRQLFENAKQAWSENDFPTEFEWIRINKKGLSAELNRILHDMNVYTYGNLSRIPMHIFTKHRLCDGRIRQEIRMLKSRFLF